MVRASNQISNPLTSCGAHFHAEESTFHPAEDMAILLQKNDANPQIVDPLESDLDFLVKTLVGSNIYDPVIVNGKVGLSRATTGCVAACTSCTMDISKDALPKEILNSSRNSLLNIKMMVQKENVTKLLIKKDPLKLETLRSDRS